VDTSDPKADSFEAATAPYRTELFAHCYRMTGSVGDAEDLVQESYLRAWKAFDSFEHRSSVRTWLYRIATNACLTALHRNRRRPVPSGLGPPSSDPYAVAVPTGAEVSWLEPVPDRLVVDERSDPADVVVARHRVRLALVAALQLLPPRQRAAVILCEALELSAAGAAELLDISVAAVKSLLQRGRARLAEAALSDVEVAEPTEAGARDVLERYMLAFEQSDPAAIKRLLADEAVIEMTGTSTWYSGKATCERFLVAQAIGRAGEWAMVPVQVNGQLGVAAYRQEADQVYSAFTIVVLGTSRTHLTRISLFSDLTLFDRFGLPRGSGTSVGDLPLSVL
jgi:RNA polymerase sigma-70 factor (ECF subfamily)